jgi:UDP-GlcNAc:undecaprenyl-phosphate/decaprenyl-phosphate GlcNAc-1-phosphate transferase
VTWLPPIVAIVITMILIHQLSPIAKQIGLIDLPDERKRHESSIPLIGGICMAIAFSLSLLLSNASLSDYRVLFFCITVTVITGALDDRNDISAAKKILVQVFVAGLLTYLGHKTIHSLGEILFVPRSYGIGMMAYPFSILAIVGIMNAFNMIDGHDGLAGASALVGFVSLAILCVSKGQIQFLLVIQVAIATLVGFLLFNIPIVFGKNKQVFMGDAGSMFIGLLMVFLLIDLSQNGNYVLKTAAAPWIVGVPLLDMISVMVLRATRKRSILIADRLHIHHMLSDMGLTKYSVLGVLIAVQCIFSAVGVLGTLFKWRDGYLFWSMFLVLGLYLGFNWLIRRVIQSRRTLQ